MYIIERAYATGLITTSTHCAPDIARHFPWHAAFNYIHALLANLCLCENSLHSIPGYHIIISCHAWLSLKTGEERPDMSVAWLAQLLEYRARRLLGSAVMHRLPDLAVEIMIGSSLAPQHFLDVRRCSYVSILVFGNGFHSSLPSWHSNTCFYDPVRNQALNS
jgi:hypothetical protein